MICHVLATSLYDDPAAGLCGDALAGLDEYPRARTVSADEAPGARVPAVMHGCVRLFRPTRGSARMNILRTGWFRGQRSAHRSWSAERRWVARPGRGRVPGRQVTPGQASPPAGCARARPGWPGSSPAGWPGGLVAGLGQLLSHLVEHPAHAVGEYLDIGAAVPVGDRGEVELVGVARPPRSVPTLVNRLRPLLQSVGRDRLGRDSVAAQHLDRPAGHADHVARFDHGHVMG